MRWRRKKKRLKKEKGKGQRIGDRAKGRRSIGVRKLTAREISTHTHITYIHIKCTFKFVLNATLSFQNGLTGKATLKKKKRRRKRKRRIFWISLDLRRFSNNGIDLKNQIWKGCKIFGLPRLKKHQSWRKKKKTEETKLSLISSSLLQRREKVFNTFIEHCEEEINNLKKKGTNEKLKTKEKMIHFKFIIWKRRTVWERIKTKGYIKYKYYQLRRTTYGNIDWRNQYENNRFQKAVNANERFYIFRNCRKVWYIMHSNENKWK